MTAEAVPGVSGLRVLRAGNASPLTLDGTRVYIVGRSQAAVLDPGPAATEHVAAIAGAVADAAVVHILLTHGHPDHAAGATELARRTGGTVRSLADGTLAAGDHVRTDAGALVAVPTPGHTPDHVAFHWPDRDVVFCGDLMLGGMDTALVAPPEGDLGDYLASLERLRALAPRLIVPTHGPPFGDAPAALERYVEHRRQRERQVVEALRGGAATEEDIVGRVYGHDLEPGLGEAARASVVGYLEHLARAGRVERSGDGWAEAARSG